MTARIISICFLISVSINARSQDTTYYKGDQTLSDKQSATYYQIVREDSVTPGLSVAESFYMNGAKKEIEYYSDKSRKNKVGVNLKWYPNGQLKRRATFDNGKLNDTTVSFWENGNVKSKIIFNHDTVLTRSCFDKKGKEVDCHVYSQMPEYPGGNKEFFKVIYDNIKMPEILKSVSEKTISKSIKTSVKVRFAVDIDGSVTDIEIIEGSHPDVDKEVVRVISMLKKFKPGLIDGEPVKVWYSLPINFQVI